MTDNRVLIDTSVWIGYFRNTSAGLCERVEAMMSEAEICVPKIVLAELLQGSKSEREIRTIENFFGAFTIVDQGEHSWVNAGKLAYQLRKKGKRVNLADCYIAVIAHEQECSILTLDEHFKDIREGIAITLL
jgi:predicted nucleic acid-binding protein